MYKKYIVPIKIPNTIPTNKISDAINSIIDYIRSGNNCIKFEMFETLSIRNKIMSEDICRRLTIDLRNVPYSTYIYDVDINSELDVYYVLIISNTDFDVSGVFIPRMFMSLSEIRTVGLDYIRDWRQ